MMNKSKLTPNKLSNIRYTYFGGETLPVGIVREWIKAAPNSVIDNLYGSTKMSACTFYRINRNIIKKINRTSLPIDTTTPKWTSLVVDDKLIKLKKGQKGELLISCPCKTLGYLNKKENNEKYIFLNGMQFYRTGDIVYKSTDNNQSIYIGRKNNQVKINGIRIEVEEIENVIKKFICINSVAVVGWPITETGVGGFVVFITDNDNTIDIKSINKELKK